MTDFVEMFRHWNAGRSQVQISEALRIDRKTIRKYLAPALAEGLQPSPDEVFDEELWRARIGRWFPELVDPTVRALRWPQIAVHHAWIENQLDVPVTVATIAQRLRDDHQVEIVSRQLVDFGSWRWSTHRDQRVMLNARRFGVVWQVLQQRV